MTTTQSDRKKWVAPKVECLEARPEITAYAGDGSRPPAGR